MTKTKFQRFLRKLTKKMENFMIWFVAFLAFFTVVVVSLYIIGFSLRVLGFDL